MIKLLVTIGLIAFAVSEVAVTGVLYDRLGLFYLIGLYCFTTLVGAAILLTQLEFMNQVAKETSVRAKNEKLHEELEEQLDGGRSTKITKEWSVLTAQGGFHTAAWLFILLPGLVTDLLGYVFIWLWFAKKDRIANML